MSRAPQSFKQSELQRIIRAIQKEGGGMAVEVLPDKTFRIIPVPSANPPDPLPDAGQIVL